ncbi:MAG: amino acid transporter [Burkholderiales bacterium]|nr:amino acid transporter [Burkholderiales bacterium]
MWMVFFKGMGLSAGLIMAIGSQNAHVLRMGLRRQHVGLTVLTCIACEIALISAGILGVGTLIASHASLLTLARWGGAAFLFWYGWRAWRSALQTQTLHVSQGEQLPRRAQALAAVLGVTLLNPHVYLDTVILLGAVGGQQAGTGKFWFGLGAIANATIWYLALGYGARLLAPVFENPQAWRRLDAAIGLMMWGLALSLLLT